MTETTNTTAMKRLRVLFVGAFAIPPGSLLRGGQLSACRAILRSPLRNQVDWVLLESMMESVPPPPLFRRAILAGLRMLKFSRHMIFSRIDVVLIFSSGEMSLVEKGSMAILAKWAGRRVVFCPRSGFLIREWRALWWTRWWLARVVSSADAVVCQGRRWVEFFCSISGLNQDRFPIIYNIVSIPDEMAVVLPRRERAKTILLMGWVERNKGIFDLVRIVERFRPELSSVKFVICGNGRDLNELKLEISRRELDDRFELRGWVDDEGRQRALLEADVCLMLSHYEGMPNSLIEAMAHGRPVVATAVGAVSDIVEDGKTGFLSEPRDIDELGFRIIELCQSAELRARFGLAGRRKVAGLMASDVVWTKWFAVLTGTDVGVAAAVVPSGRS